MPQKNWLEWSIFAFSVLVLAGVFGYLGYDAIDSEGKPAEIKIELGSPVAHDGYWAIQITVRNSGGQSVEDAEIDVMLIQNGQESEMASVTFPFLPRESTREGWVAFSSNPADADEIQTQVVSYVVP